MQIKHIPLMQGLLIEPQEEGCHFLVSFLKDEYSKSFLAEMITDGNVREETKSPLAGARYIYSVTPIGVTNFCLMIEKLIGSDYTGIDSTKRLRAALEDSVKEFTPLHFSKNCPYNKVLERIFEMSFLFKTQVQPEEWLLIYQLLIAGYLTKAVINNGTGQPIQIFALTERGEAARNPKISS